MEAWPESLPPRALADFDISNRAGLNSDEEENNPERTRTHPEKDATFRVLMNLTQLVAFRAFLETTLNQCAPFTAPWLEAAGYEFHYLRFREAPSWSNVGGGYWTVVLPVEIIAGIELDSESNIDIYPPEGGGGPQAISGDSGDEPTQEGLVVAWGDSVSSITHLPSDLYATRIDASHYIGAALKSDGTIEAWGASAYLEYIPGYDSLGGIKAISVGGYSSNVFLAYITNSGAIGICHPGTTITNAIESGIPGEGDFVDIAAGYFGCVALKSDGTIKAWGYNEGSIWHQMPSALELANVRKIGCSSGMFGSVYAITDEDILYAWGLINSTNGIYQVQTISNVSVGGVSSHIAAASRGGGNYEYSAYRSQYYADLDGAEPSGLVPVEISFGVDVVSTSNPYCFALAIHSDGTVVGWGQSCPGLDNIPSDLKAHQVVALRFYGNASGGIAIQMED